MDILVVSFLIFSFFQSVLYSHIEQSNENNPYNISKFESTLWDFHNLMLYHFILLQFVKYGSYAFLILMAVKTEWYYPILLYIGTIMFAIVTVVPLRLFVNWIIAPIVLIGTIVLPITFIVMWLALLAY